MKQAIPASIFQVRTMARSVRITVDTQENISKDQLGELFALYDKIGWFMFLPRNQTSTEQIELPEIHLEKSEKSPSQRLRAVLYIYWQQNGSKDDFELFYRRWMERAIDQIKQKLL